MGVSLEKQEIKLQFMPRFYHAMHLFLMMRTSAFFFPLLIIWRIVPQIEYQFGIAFVFNDENFCVFLPPLNYLENCATGRISVRNNQPAKRQRMWNSETVKGSNPQMSTVRPATAPKGESNALKRNLSWSDSSAINDAPKERIGK
jgi:hypothetical protein